MPFRLGFITGATPDKWARAWRDRSKVSLELTPFDAAVQSAAPDEFDMCLVRLPIDRDDLHVVRLYDEVPVVVLPIDHHLTLADEVELADLADEQVVLSHDYGWRPTADQLPWPAMSVKDAVEVVAGGQGVVLVPMSVARLHHRKDVTPRPVVGLDPTTVALVWRRERDDELTQEFVAVVRGRTARSSRG